ncbi:MAG: hypothetical protein AABX01_07980 [Candidatus Micrarchaeota archaeon]
MELIRGLGLTLAIVLINSFPVFSQTPDDYSLPSAEELFSNSTPLFIDLLNDPSPVYNMQLVDPGKTLVALIPVNASYLSKIQCIAPEKSQQCECVSVENIQNPQSDLSFAQFKCTFFPEVDGTYKINVESEYGYGNFTMTLSEGAKPDLKSHAPKNDIPDWLWRFAVIFVILIAVSYASYFLYKLMMRKRDALRALQDQRQKIEDDMKVLRFRFFKREIDANTYGALFKQKEKELADMNEKILKKMKPKSKVANSAENN